MMDTKVRYTADILDKLFEFSVDLLCICDRDGKIIKPNPKLESLFGYSLSEIKGSTLFELIHPDDAGRLSEAFNCLLNNKETGRFISRCKHKNGSLLWIDWNLFLADSYIIASLRDVTNHIEIERKLNESEEKYHILSDISNDFILKVAVSQNNIFSVVYASNNLSPCFDHLVVDMHDSDLWNKYLHRDDVPSFGEYLRSLINDAVSCSCECRLKVNDSYRWFNIIGKPECDLVNQRVIFIVFAIKDIHERKTTELSLKSELSLSEKRFRSIFACSNIGIALINLKGRFIMVNNVLCQMLDYAEQELLSLSIFEITYPDDIEITQAELKSEINHQKSVSFIKRNLTKTGKTVWANVSSSLIPDDDGKPLYLVVHVNDITQYRNSQENVLKSEIMLRSFFNESSEGILIVNEDGNVVEWNKSASRITGLSQEEVMNKPWTNLEERLRTSGSENRPDKKIIEAKVKEVLRTGKFNIPLHSEFPIMLFNGEKRFLESRLFVIKSEKGYKLAQIFTDITERKKAEDEILKLNRDLEKKVEERTQKLNAVVKDLEAFAYSVSHDLRSPLRHIDGFLKLLYTRLNQPSELVTNYYNKVIEATQRMSVMIDSLLTFSRLGRKELTISEINTQTLISEIIAQLMPDTEQRSIKWNISNLPNIKGDRNTIKIALENIISNAIKYTSKKSEAVIEIGGNVSNDNTELFVKDNGIGFDMNYSDKLFGVFQRLHSFDDFDGIGIGLANVKQIIEKHKGSVRSESKLNEGATFYIKLPN